MLRLLAGVTLSNPFNKVIANEVIRENNNVNSYLQFG